ncbi:hypothetical protein AB6A40_007989 [Gnathostoma spinigerum]|uniref:CUB domain-containing protein n=1 Tax=Gnathostoma spinigerum TaxID=75299 RepID=A0ABD6EP24_9BILA
MPADFSSRTFRDPRVLFVWCTLLSASYPLPLMDYEISGGEVIELPVGHFPDPECDYTVRLKDRNGPRLQR